MYSPAPYRVALAAALLALCPLTPSARADEPAPKRPNIVVVVADDLGWSDLGCYGSTLYETPHLDRLAAEGTRFTDAYASCPVCSPSRASLMTGKSPAGLGMTAHVGDLGPLKWSRNTPLLPAHSIDALPAQEVTLAEALHDAGYATMHAGKWHLGHEASWPEYHGFDVNAGGWSQGGPFGGKQYFSPYGNPRLPDGPPGEHLPDRLATEVERFVQAHRFEPFFVHLAWYSVHVPLVGRADLVEKYRKKIADLGGEVGVLQETADGKVRARQDHAIYAAMVEAMDLAFGRVTRALEAAGVADNTLVLFTSDNGGLSTGDIAISAEEGWPTTNAPLRAGKGWLYEGGIRVPLLVKAPMLKASDAKQPTPDGHGAESGRVVVTHDLYPTVLELAGVTKPAEQSIEGLSFVDALEPAASDAVQASRPPVYWHYPHYGNQGGRPGGAIRDGDWKLIEWYAPSNQEPTVELYNLAADPGEAKDLATEHPEVCERLLESLRTWREKSGAQMPTDPSRVASRRP